MRRVIRKRVRHKEDGLDLAIEVNADIAINAGRQAAVSEQPAEEPEREPETESTHPGEER